MDDRAGSKGGNRRLNSLSRGPLLRLCFRRGLGASQQD